jgi:type III secretion system YscJ/HrcJ family lipoprotein
MNTISRHLLACLLPSVLFVAGCDRRAQLLQLESEREATRVLVELAKAGIEADKTATTANRKTVQQIRVDPQQLDAARDVLVRLDLPKENIAGYDTIIARQGLIPTETDERARLMYAMAGELERTFETYDNVVTARVHVVLPQRDPLRRAGAAEVGPSALVVIKLRAPDSESLAVSPATQPTLALNPFVLPGQPPELTVKQMVSRSIEGIGNTDHIQVHFTTAQPVKPATPVRTRSFYGSVGVDRDLMLALFVAVVVQGLLILVLISLLWSRRRKTPAVDLDPMTSTTPARAS